MNTHLTQPEIEQILQSPDTLALYLMTLSPLQLEIFCDQVENMNYEEDVKQNVITFLQKVKTEALLYEQEVCTVVHPAMIGISTAMTLQKQIIALEALEQSLA
jgi:hypothetical protein